MAKKNNSTANLGFEEKLWAAADKMRRHIESSEYVEMQERLNIENQTLAEVRDTLLPRLMRGEVRV